MKNLNRINFTPNQVHQTLHTNYIYNSHGYAGFVNSNSDKKFDVTFDNIHRVARTSKAVIYYINVKEAWRYKNQHNASNFLQYIYCDLQYDII